MRSPEGITLSPQRLRVALHLDECGGRAKFTDVLKALDMTSGRLSVFARKLEDDGVIVVQKSFRRRVPMTTFLLTEDGRCALANYKAKLEPVRAEAIAS